MCTLRLYHVWLIDTAAGVQRRYRCSVLVNGAAIDICGTSEPRAGRYQETPGITAPGGGGTPSKHLARPSPTRGVPFPSLGLHPNINIITLWWGYGDTRAPQTSRECLSLLSLSFSALAFSLGPNPTRRVPRDNVLKGLSSLSLSSLSPYAEQPFAASRGMRYRYESGCRRFSLERVASERRISDPIIVSIRAKMDL